jgi:rRNA maturation protein Nop10
VSMVFLPCPKCGKMHAFPVGALKFVGTLKITCKCGGEIVRSHPDKNSPAPDELMR